MFVKFNYLATPDKYDLRQWENTLPVSKSVKYQQDVTELYKPESGSVLKEKLDPDPY